MKGRRLARAVRADEPDDLARCHRERHAAHRGDASVGDLEPLQLEHGRGHLGVLVNRGLSEVCGGDVEVRPDLGRRALGESRPVVEHLDAVADVHHEGHVVVDEEHARVVLVAHRADHGREVGHLGLGKSRRGLVEEHECEARSQARERRRGAARPRARASLPERVACALRWRRSSSSSARLRAALEAAPDAERRDLDVLADR